MEMAINMKAARFAFGFSEIAIMDETGRMTEAVDEDEE